MAIHDFNAQRLHLSCDLKAGQSIDCASEQVNYLVNVLRVKPGSEILVFNGRDGEWRCRVAVAQKRSCVLEIAEQVREQEPAQDLHYYFAPLKRGRLDYMVQKAVEMGVSHLHPVLTRHTVAERVKLERMRANAIEAAEQCGILNLADISEPRKLDAVLDDWPQGRRLIFCDELAEIADPVRVLAGIPDGSNAVLIGPEGGFSESERARLLAAQFAYPISLGPRIMRADTAAVAALALVNAVRGDWRVGADNKTSG